MKTLYLIRHAKSSWDDPKQSDFDRPLNERGKRNAPFMGKLLKKEIMIPDLILSSPAKRAITTARKIAEELEYPSKNIQEVPAIYEASVSTLLKIVNQISDQYDSVFLFGHNPGFTDFLNYLTDAGIGNIPTCGVAQIRFEVDSWKLVSKDMGELVRFEYPKKYVH